MKPSPLNLLQYFVMELAVIANREFKPTQPILLSWDDLCVTHELFEPVGQPPTIVLRIRQNVPPAKNAPYNFSLELVGRFQVHPQCPADKRQLLLKTNGTSMLYGAAREIIRSATAHGPFVPLLLPSGSFYENNTIGAASTAGVAY